MLQTVPATMTRRDMAKEVHQLKPTDTETMLAVLQSENARLKDCAKVNAERDAESGGEQEEL
jgi:hypothetical protein